MAIHYSAVTETQMRVIKRRLFDQVVDRRLLVQRARHRGVQVTRSEMEKALREALRDAPQGFIEILKDQGVEEGAWKRKVAQEFLVRKLAEQEVYRKVKIGDAEVEAYYWSHLGVYWQPEAIRARHLVVSSFRELQKVQARLTAGEPFEKVAADSSLAPPVKEGGDWGWLPMEGLSRRYARALLALKPGEVSKVVQDGFGWHLFQLIEIRPTRMREFRNVEGEIRDNLVKLEQNRRFILWIDGLKKTATVEVNQDLASIVGIVWEDSRDHVMPAVRKPKRPSKARRP
jgi:parvulin-like peptidyl-prolyl isomerase